MVHAGSTPANKQPFTAKVLNGGQPEAQTEYRILVVEAFYENIGHILEKHFNMAFLRGQSRGQFKHVEGCPDVLRNAILPR